MPNHLHILLYLPNAAGSIDKIIGNGKRFMAYEIVKILKTKKKFELLYKLEKAVPMKERKIGKLHHVFEPSFDSKVIMTRKFLTQKLNYIHFNPVAKKWNLVEDYRLYKHSSAGFYEVEDYKGYKITHYLEIYS